MKANDLFDCISARSSITKAEAETWLSSPDLRLRAVAVGCFEKVRNFSKIQPPLTQSEWEIYYLNYLFECVDAKISGDDWIHSAYEACWDLAWLFNLYVRKNRSAVTLKDIADRFGRLLILDDSKKTIVINGFLEHIDRAARRRVMKDWHSDPSLSAAYIAVESWLH